MISTRHHGSVEDRTQALNKEETHKGEADMEPSIPTSTESIQGISDSSSNARPAKALCTRSMHFQDLNQDVIEYTDWLAMESERHLGSSSSEKGRTSMAIDDNVLAGRKPRAVDPTIEISPRIVEVEDDERKPVSSAKTSTTPGVETRGGFHSFGTRTIQAEGQGIGFLRRAQKRKQELLSRGHSWKKHLFENSNT